MSEDTKALPEGPFEGDQVSLHLLREEDFPWLLLWMVKETHASLAWLLQTTKGSEEIIIITGIINGRERVGLLTVYSSVFTRLKTPYILVEGEYSIQNLQLNPLIYGRAALTQLLPRYLDFLLARAGAKKIYWEIHHTDKLYTELAREAGFGPSAIQGQAAYTLYEYAGKPAQQQSPNQP